MYFVSHVNGDNNNSSLDRLANSAVCTFIAVTVEVKVKTYVEDLCRERVDLKSSSVKSLVEQRAVGRVLLSPPDWRGRIRTSNSEDPCW